MNYQHNDVEVIVLHFMISVLQENHDQDAGLPATNLQPHDDNEEWEIIPFISKRKVWRIKRT